MKIAVTTADGSVHTHSGTAWMCVRGHVTPVLESGITRCTHKISLPGMHYRVELLCCKAIHEVDILPWEEKGLGTLAIVASMASNPGLVRSHTSHIEARPTFLSTCSPENVLQAYPAGTWESWDWV